MIKGFCLGRFDFLHPGHIDLFKLAKTKSDYVVVGLMENPFQEFPEKEALFTLDEKVKILESIKFIDEVVVFNSQEKILKWLSENKMDKLFTGSEYKKNQPLSAFFKGRDSICYINETFRSSDLKKRL